MEAQATPETPAPDRRAERTAALAAAQEVLAASNPNKVELMDALGRLTAAVTPARRAAAGPRETLEKADPQTVAAYFESTGLTRKQLAGAAGVSTSVIATVQNEKGDRWSTKTFEAKRELIDAYVGAHKDEIAAARAADEAAATAKATAATAKTARAAARAAKATPTAPAPAARKAKGSSAPAQDGAAAPA